jgi:hypothetical protein
MNNPDHVSESLETIFWVKILKFFDVYIQDLGWIKFGSGIEKILIQDRKNTDPGWKYFGSGIRKKIIPDSQHCNAGDQSCE